MKARDVVFVDGVRTPFGKSGPKGIYAETRADDLVCDDSSFGRDRASGSPSTPTRTPWST